MTIDDAFNYIVSLLKRGQTAGRGGYDLYIQDAVDKFLIERERLNRDVGSGYPFRDRGNELSPHFLSAAWELCRRGVLRPGVREIGSAGVGNNEFGSGYALTVYGRTWLERADYEELASVIPGRFVELLSSHASRFGPGFLGRGKEAIGCYGAHAFLACCAMCGAAAESILLSLATERKAAVDVLRMYSSAGGRGRVENLLIGQSPERTRREFQAFMMLISYWRDEAAHGRASLISETEAFTSLMLLLRLARFADESFPRPA